MRSFHYLEVLFYGVPIIRTVLGWATLIELIKAQWNDGDVLERIFSFLFYAHSSRSPPVLITSPQPWELGILRRVEVFLWGRGIPGNNEKRWIKDPVQIRGVLHAEEIHNRSWSKTLFYVCSSCTNHFLLYTTLPIPASIFSSFFSYCAPRLVKWTLLRWSLSSDWS